MARTNNAKRTPLKEATTAASKKTKKKPAPLGNHVNNKENIQRTPPNTNQKKKRPSPTSALRLGDSKRRKAAAATTKLRAMPNGNALEALPYPDAKELLGKLEKDVDRHLQLLLWEIDCHYVLLPHQFRGVRALAGVPEDYPGTRPAPPAKEEALMEWVVTTLEKAPPSKDRGVLMADVMGLGKTVQAVAACMLRNALALAKGQPRKPTLIVSPNDAVLLQWQETLIKANVNPNAIFRFQTKSNKAPVQRHHFVLCNRYDLLTEARTVFERLSGKGNNSNTYKGSLPLLKSPLFPNAKKALLECLTNQYEAEQGREKNWFKAQLQKAKQRNDDHQKQQFNIGEIVTKSLCKYVDKVETVYETVVIDEAHFLKNLAAYWGMAAGLLGLHTNRMIPMSGTPYNNSCQDVATQMAFIDPRLGSANEKWWKNATKSCAARDVQAEIREWSDNYLVRRDKDVIASQLPKKIITKKHVGPLPLELTVYEHYEYKFLEILKKFQNLERQRLDRFQRQKMKDYFELMLAFASCMRAALIHPLLAGGGRDFTILFSPSRGKRKGLLLQQEKGYKCVCCPRNTRKEKKKQRDNNKSKQKTGELEEFADDENDDAASLVDFIVSDDVVEFEDDEQEDEGPSEDDRKPSAKHAKKEAVKDEEVKAKDEEGLDSEDERERIREERRAERREAMGIRIGTGEVVPIPSTLCHVAKHGIRHFACESCLEDMQDEGRDCPACTMARSRLRLDHAKDEVRKMKKESAKGKQSSDESDDKVNSMEINRKLYCENIFGGFRASAKLESIIEDYQNMPKDDKVLICSFFKGSLDLLEAIFHDMGVGTARFDGDVDSEERQMELDRFKEDESCRVLLLTVQTGGTGLNLVNANHVWFVDRFWNPMVMEQAEDRCYRMGQTKDVDVTYHDVSYTTDDVMRHINDAKTENAKIILANGAQLSTSTAGMSFKDISGELGNSVRAIRDQRMVFVTSNNQRIYEPLPPSPQGLLEAADRAVTQSKFANLLEAIASMLGYSVPPRAAANPTARANPGATDESPPIPMEIDTGGDSKPAAPSDQVKPAEEDKKDSKLPVVVPLQTMSEANSGSVDLIDLEDSDSDFEDSKPAAVSPTSLTKSSNNEPDQAKSGQVASLIKPEQVPSKLSPASASSTKQAHWLDDDSDDDSVLDAAIMKKSSKKKGGK